MVLHNGHVFVGSCRSLGSTWMEITEVLRNEHFYCIYTVVLENSFIEEKSPLNLLSNNTSVFQIKAAEIGC